MFKDPKGPLPRMHVLRAFDAAARHSSFIRAADELGTHQPIVSRYIAELEHEIGTQLFERSHRSVNLTPAGEIYHRGVTIGLDRIAAGAITASSIGDEKRVTVTCSHAISHQFVMPRFKSLRQALGEKICLRILTVDYSILKQLGEHEADMIITYDETVSRLEDRVTLFSEAFTPVCSPDFAATHANVLAQPVKEWGALPFLRPSHDYGWSTWHDWFETVEYPSPRPQFISIEDYVYLIEAAIDGQGLALGWRYYIDQYLKEGVLVAVGNGFVEGIRNCFAKLTKRGSQRPVARQCLEVFSNIADVTSSDLQSGSERKNRK